jgi:polar amino acid transport system substrate-binding protein
MRLFWHEKSDVLEHDLQNLMRSGKTFVINSGGYYGKEFKQLSQQAEHKGQIVQVKMIEQRLNMLQAKRIDFMIDDEVSGLYLLAQKKITAIALHPYVINDNPIHFMFSNKTVNTAHSQKIDDAIKQLETPIIDIIANYTQ